MADNDNMGVYGAALFQALKPPTADEVRSYMDGANKVYAERHMKLELPKHVTAYSCNGSVQFRED